VAHLTHPQDVLSDKISHGVPSISTLRARTAVNASDADIEEIAERIGAAEKIAIFCGIGCRGAVDELREVSDRLKAPLIHTVRGKDMMPYSDVRWMGGLGMIGTKPNYKAVQECDLLLMLGTDYPYSDSLPKNPQVIQIDEKRSRSVAVH
jgi:pyruvate dehydrogenase (quinone)